MMTASQRVFGFGRRLARDEGGAALIYVSIALTVFMGFAALVIDGSRLFTLDTEMQSAADALALAGAAELDGGADAIDRAENAMAAMVENNQTFGTGADAITDYEARFLSGLPDNDADEIPDDLVLDPDDEDSNMAARFVQVRLIADDRREIDSMFATAVGGTDTPAAGADAVAGFTSAVCKFTPLFMCNPYDTPADFFANVGQPDEKRRVIALKQSDGGEAKYGPGNFGFLGHIDPSEENSFKEALATAVPGTCFAQSGVDTEPGNKVSARTALNTRFDLYEGKFKNDNDETDFRPARNVTKGYTATSDCKQSEADPSVAMGFPSDGDIDEDTRMGNGDWEGQFDAYWDLNHPGVDKPHSWSSGNLPSRYDVYRWETETTDMIPDNSPGGENGNPQCYKETLDPVDGLDRRVLYAAIIDCDTYGELVKGRAEDIPVLAFVKMFMTQPMTKKDECKEVGSEPGGGNDKGDGGGGDPGPDNDEEVDCNDTLFVEMIETVQPGIDDEVLHDIVQLYR